MGVGAGTPARSSGGDIGVDYVAEATGVFTTGDKVRARWHAQSE